jgi:hypothetical protein
MKRKFALLLGLLMLIVSVGIASAQDMPNWCDAPDGVWYYGDGLHKCNTQPDAWSNGFMWLAGYYGALYDAGEITLDELFAINPAIAGHIIEVRLPQLLIAPPSSGGSGDSSSGGGSISLTYSSECLTVNNTVIAGGSTQIKGIRLVGTSPNIAFQKFLDTSCETPYSANLSGGSYFTAADQAAADAFCGAGFEGWFSGYDTNPKLWECEELDY